MNTTILALYAKAMIHRPSNLQISKDIVHEEDNKGLEGLEIERVNYAPKLPNISCQKTIVIQPKHCNKYNTLTQWKPGLAALVHPNYFQTLSLPLQLEMLVNKDFPFAPMGLVHVANQITVNQLPNQSDSLHLNTRFGNIYLHKKGWLFEVITSASPVLKNNLKNPLMHATSFYLARMKHDNNLINNKPQAPDWLQTLDENQCNVPVVTHSMKFASDIGRKYASVSGDYNPIHLYALSAKLFGFKKAIAHGMFSKAIIVSRLAGEFAFYKGAFEIETLFKQPISLPSEAMLSYAHSKASPSHGPNTAAPETKIPINFANTLHMTLNTHNSRKERCLLKGEIRF
jgi:hypothetical protein